MSGQMSIDSQNSIERLLSPAEAAKLLNVSISWLAKARMSGEGPEFVKIGRSVRYSEPGIRKFTRLQTRVKTGA